MFELVLPALEQHHEVLALTLPGHAGGPPVGDEMGATALADAVERAMNTAGFARAHLVGSSLGGHVALQLAARDRADTVVALAPAGGWAADDQSYRDLLGFQRTLREQARIAAPVADAILASREGRRRATQLLTEKFEHIPPELLVHQLIGVANCSGAERMIEYGLQAAWSIDAEQVTCPIRVVWGAGDRLLPWPRAAARYRREWLPHADWIVLDDVGHYPHLDVPLETAQLILGFTSPGLAADADRPPDRVQW